MSDTLMKKARLVLAICAGAMSNSLLEAQIDRNFWKSDAEIDEFYGNAAPERGAAAQHASLASIMDRISKVNEHPDTENIGYCGEKLRKLSRGNIYQLKERFEVYDKVQETLLAIPGHSRYYADEIKREQKEVAQYPTNTGPRVTYDFNRGLHFMTMRYLPSPETISVLGEFLSDDIDTPVPLNSPDSDWGENPRANSYFSADTIHKIGLRNPPLSPTEPALMPEDHLALTRAWWDEIKSGRKAFSFVGQDVEYRFKPDGTWETMPLGSPPDRNRPLKRPDAVRPASPVSPAVHTRWWIGIGGLGLLALAIWLWRKKTT
jgi:hypothetical protein